MADWKVYSAEVLASVAEKHKKTAGWVIIELVKGNKEIKKKCDAERFRVLYAGQTPAC